MSFILSLDSSNGYSCVSITGRDSGSVIAESVSGFHENHSVNVFKQLEEVTRKAGICFSDFSDITAVVGPGSFTGIRVSLTIAKAMSFALGINITGVGSLFVSAYYLSMQNLGGSGGESGFERIIAVKNGIRGRYYVSEYAVSGGRPVDGAKIMLLDREEINSLAAGSGQRKAVVFGYNEEKELETVSAKLAPEYFLTGFCLKDTNRFASMLAIENKRESGFEYAEGLSPYYVYGDGPF